MSRTWLTRTIVGGAAALALVGGGAIAFAQTQSAPPANAVQSFLDDVASRLGVQPSALQSAIQQAETDQVNQAVRSGRLTSQQAQKVERAIQSGNLQWGPIFGGANRAGGSQSALLAGAASYLGITPQALQTQLRSGKTLAQIANTTSGKSAAGLQAYLVNQLQAGARTKLEMAVKDGRMTQAQASQQLQTLLHQARTAIGNLMNGTTTSSTSGK